MDTSNQEPKTTTVDPLAKIKQFQSRMHDVVTKTSNEMAGLKALNALMSEASRKNMNGKDLAKRRAKQKAAKAARKRNRR